MLGSVCHQSGGMTRSKIEEMTLLDLMQHSVTPSASSLDIVLNCIVNQLITEEYHFARPGNQCPSVTNGITGGRRFPS